MAVDMLSLLPSRPPAAALDMPNRILLWSMRQWLRSALADQLVTPGLAASLESLGMSEMAAPVAVYMDEAAAAWPERLRLLPVGCGCPIGYDEWLLLSCVADAGCNARDAFDGRLCEMIGPSQRDRLWRAAVRLAEVAGRPTHW